MKKLMFSILGMVLAFSIWAMAKDNSGSSGQSDNSGASATAQPELKTITGWVSDEKCGAKGASEKGAACSKKCVEGGQKIVFVNDADHKVWNVKNPEELKDHVGHHVQVDAHVYDDGSIHI